MKVAEEWYEEFNAVADNIRTIDDLATIREINRLAYDRCKHLEDIARSAFKVGQPCSVEANHGQHYYGRIVKVNPKTVKVAVTESDMNAEHMRGKTVMVNAFQVTPMENIDSGI